jgi:mono/diheme cytochrome c family protein
MPQDAPHRRVPALVAGLAALLLSAGPAAADGSVAQGRRLAETLCARCHLVAPGQPAVSGWTDAPRFTAIAADRKVTPAWLRGFFAQPHWNMLYTDRPPQEQADLAAYILSLTPR